MKLELVIHNDIYFNVYDLDRPSMYFGFFTVLNYNRYDLHVFTQYQQYDYLKIHRKECTYDEALKLAKEFMKNSEIAAVFS